MKKQIETDVVKIDPLYPSEEAIERAALFLRQGQLVIFPTETVYGLGADVFQPAALERVFAAKGRPLNDPLIVHIADEAALAELTTEISEIAGELIRTFWPGPLTLILPRGSRVPYLATAGMETVAIRMPRHPVARALIKALGSPIAAPSANRFMHISPTTAGHALADLGGCVPIILDGGPCEIGVESTILDLSTETPTLLRPGGVSLEALHVLLPGLRQPANNQVRSEEMAQKAPGQLARHYAPSIPLLLFDGSEEAMRVAMLSELRERVERGERVGVLIADADLPAFQAKGALVATLGDAAQPTQIAAALFASLHALEDARVQVILCRDFAGHELGLAIRDRLKRAAGGKIIRV